MERKLFDKEINYRSPMFAYHLFEKYGDKECTFCGCRIPEIIEGAHIWPVASIKCADRLSDDEKLNSAVDADNGLWLCQNHHKLFDENLITITESGSIIYRTNMNDEYVSFIEKTTTKRQIERNFLNKNFVNFVQLRADNM